MAVVNQFMAERYWGNADRAIGRFLRVDGQSRQIVGVVETGKYGNVLENPRPYFFLFTGGGDNLVIETADAPAVMAEPVRQALRRIAPDVTVQSVVTLRAQMGMAYYLWQAGAGLFGIAAILGIFLAAVGLYGILAHGVSRRAHEIGVRMAMGARPADVLKLVLRQGLSMVAIGAALGVAAAVVGARYVSQLLYHISPGDPVAVFGGLAAVAVVAILATHVPARRATRADPMKVLRQE